MVVGGSVVVVGVVVATVGGVVGGASVDVVGWVGGAERRSDATTVGWTGSVVDAGASDVVVASGRVVTVVDGGRVVLVEVVGWVGTATLLEVESSRVARYAIPPIAHSAITTPAMIRAALTRFSRCACRPTAGSSRPPAPRARGRRSCRRSAG